MVIPCGVCDGEHADTAAFVAAHPDEAANIRGRVAFVHSVQPEADAEAVGSIVGFLGRLAVQGYEVRRLRG